ncbi:unnamed protein product [marine sediment metagenome]|uniref:Uncharacterized protein n=1 Tax=marine sediment metagenome TaxID=412755 RepID=X1AGI2_9ZZZZ
MGNIGYFFPIFIVFCVIVIVVLGLLDKWLAPKSSYEKWLEEELRKNPDYINWLKTANNGRHYKLGLRILRKIKKGGKKS